MAYLNTIERVEALNKAFDSLTTAQLKNVAAHLLNDTPLYQNDFRKVDDCLGVCICPATMATVTVKGLEKLKSKNWRKIPKRTEDVFDKLNGKVSEYTAELREANLERYGLFSNQNQNNDVSFCDDFQELLNHTSKHLIVSALTSACIKRGVL